MQIKPAVPFISEVKLEQLAYDLLEQYDRHIAPIATPPVPVEKIADFWLELNIDWLTIPDSDEEPILAYLHPESRTIRFNERRLAHFEQYPGSYEFTLAHEIGHFILHLMVDEGSFEPANPAKSSPQNRREWQAEQFAGYLLLPAALLQPAIKGQDLCHWPTLYRLRDTFQVSITALRVRLEKMGYLYLAPNGRLYRSKDAATHDRRQVGHKLIGQAGIYRAMGQTAPAQAAYQQALTIAQELGDRQQEAFCAWELGRLLLQTDPARAIDLLSLCVAYERETGHPQAEADAAFVAGLKDKSILSPQCLD